MPIAYVHVGVFAIQKFKSRTSDFDDCPFSKCMDILKIFFTSEDKILETTSCQVFTTIKWLQWEYVVLKLVDDFLGSRYASLTTKSSDFVWSITSRNLNQSQQN